MFIFVLFICEYVLRNETSFLVFSICLTCCLAFIFLCLLVVLCFCFVDCFAFGCFVYLFLCVYCFIFILLCFVLFYIVLYLLFCFIWFKGTHLCPFKYCVFPPIVNILGSTVSSSCF